jgi:hypothetical protein
LLASTGEYNTDEVENVYRSWLDSASSDEGITIADVGEIRGGKMIVAPKLHGELNPVDDEIVMEKERSVGPLWAWILGGIVLAALILGGFMCCKHGWLDSCFCGKNGCVETVQTTVSEPVEPAVAAEPEPADITAPEPAGTRYHVIAGSFAIEANADNYIERLQAKHPELTVEKIYNPETGYNMVSIIQAPTERQANAKISYYWDIDLGIWVYKEN